MGDKEISEFLTQLAVKGNVAAATQNSPREIKTSLNEEIFLCLYLSITKNLQAIEKLSHGVKALCAIVFLYKHILKKDVGELENLVWAKRPEILPEVFTLDEVDRVIAQLKNIYWLIGILMYGAGLRLIESLRLRVYPVR